MSALIFDGFTTKATISALAGQHPEVRVEFRPALYEERSDFLAGKDFDGKAAVKRVALIIHRHLLAWDVVNLGGEAVSPTPEMIRRLHPNVMTKLLDLILGYSAAEEEADAKN